MAPTTSWPGPRLEPPPLPSPEPLAGAPAAPRSLPPIEPRTATQLEASLAWTDHSIKKIEATLAEQGNQIREQGEHIQKHEETIHLLVGTSALQQIRIKQLEDSINSLVSKLEGALSAL